MDRDVERFLKTGGFSMSTRRAYRWVLNRLMLDEIDVVGLDDVGLIDWLESHDTWGTMATEYIWYNYPTPEKLHDYSFLGNDFTDRQRIKRKIARWSNKLKNLPALERNAIIDSITAGTIDSSNRDTTPIQKSESQRRKPHQS